MSTAVNVGARLDRLPIGPFHYRILWLIGLGMFFDGFDIYVLNGVIGATLKSGFLPRPLIQWLISATFVGMMIGAFATGFVGDRFGRRFTYQINLFIFGGASLLAAFAPSIWVLIFLRFIIGIGLGAENVTGFAAMAEFVPAATRGKWVGLIITFVVFGLPVTSLLSYFIIPASPEYGWRIMFAIGGVGALIVWYLRKRLPESPRWLESMGRNEEAEALMQKIEAEAAQGKPLPAPQPAVPIAPSGGFAGLFTTPSLLARLFVGSICLVTINAWIYGFVVWLPSIFVSQGFSLGTSLGYVLLMALGAPIGSVIGAFGSDGWGRKPTIIGASLAIAVLGFIYPQMHDPIFVVVVGFLLTIPIYMLVALNIAIYIPELFPTDVRLRGAGFCNAVGRGATIITPFIVSALLLAHGVPGVMAFLIGLVILQIVVVAILGIEPRHRALEALKTNEVVTGQSVEA
jgi:putative MFS transporter